MLAYMKVLSDITTTKRRSIKGEDKSDNMKELACRVNCWILILFLQTIQAVQPDVVLVELCKSRVDILKYDEEFLLREAKNIDMQKLKLAIKQVSTTHFKLIINNTCSVIYGWHMGCLLFWFSKGGISC